MRNLHLAFSAVLILSVSQGVRPAVAAEWEYAEWLSDAKGGSGGWTDTTRWKDGKLPTETKNVLITDADAWITDADAAILNKLTRIRLDGTAASLELRFDQDQGVKINSIQELGASVVGRLVKTGAGTVTLTNVNSTTLSELCVSNGTFLIDSGRSAMEVSRFAVARPATLAFNEAANFSLSALVCDGLVTNMNVKAVKISVGKLSHADEASWTLPEYMRPTEDVLVKGGTFVLHQPLYTYYRIIFKENGGDLYAQTYGLRMNDAENRYVNSNFTYKAEANGNPSKLGKGEIAFHDSGYWCDSKGKTTGMERGVDKLASGKKNLFSVQHSTKKTITTSDSTTWVGAIMRLKEDAPAVVSYDFATHCSSNPNRTPRVWTFEGSRDGATWDLLHSYSTNALPTSAHNYWVSSDTSDFEKGFPVAVGPTPALQSLPRVTLSGGATLKAEYAAEMSALALDCATGGTIDGGVFAASGTLNLVGLPAGFCGEISVVSFTNVTGLDNLSNWTLQKNGKPCRGTISLKDGKLWFTPSGSVLFVR